MSDSGGIRKDECYGMALEECRLDWFRPSGSRVKKANQCHSWAENEYHFPIVRRNEIHIVSQLVRH